MNWTIKGSSFKEGQNFLNSILRRVWDFLGRLQLLLVRKRGWAFSSYLQIQQSMEKHSPLSPNPSPLGVPISSVQSPSFKVHRVTWPGCVIPCLVQFLTEKSYSQVGYFSVRNQTHHAIRHTGQVTRWTLIFLPGNDFYHFPQRFDLILYLCKLPQNKS